MESCRIITLKKWWRMIVCIIAIAVIVSGLVSGCILSKVYISTSTFIVDGLCIGDEYIVSRGAKAYRAVAASNQVMEEVISRLNLNYDVKDMQKKTKVSYEENTGLIYIAIEDRDAKTAYQIANTLVDVMQERIEEIFGKNYLRVLDNPCIPSRPSRPNVPLNIFISALIGIFLSALIIAWNERDKGK
ncbi:YveK family protein [Xylanivirga thermophila]|uniref:YveK family protein n=1 Tax=Xylanivirga thermophila TaxID=2496273 RepID=UPI00101D2B8C|nr:hypothetical protein [Xylanivirga thermophila]